jgi:deoxycytidylate deaminase
MIEAGHDPFFVQKLPVSSQLKGVDRRKVFATLCEGKRVLHVGCADSPITDVSNNLHCILQPFAKILDGFDLDEKSLDILRPHVTRGSLFSNIEQIIEHVANVESFLNSLDKLKFKDLVITAPDAFSCMQRHFEYSQGTSTFCEIVHPDHNAWYTPYTLFNVLKKYTSWDINGMYFLGNISIMALCSKRVAN